MTLKSTFNPLKAFLCALLALILLAVIDSILIHTGHPRSWLSLLALALLVGGAVLLYRKWPWSWPSSPPPRIVP